MQDQFKRQAGFLTAEDACYMSTLRDAPYREALHELIRRAEHSMREAAYAPGAESQKEIIIEVPLYIVDRVPYDLDRVMPDLVIHFRTQNFVSEWTKPNLLFVSWAHVNSVKPAST